MKEIFNLIRFMIYLKQEQEVGLFGVLRLMLTFGAPENKRVRIQKRLKLRFLFCLLI